MEILIGSKLKQLRKDKKISIAELSRMSEVSTGLISQIERDLVVPSITSLWRLANALNTNINYFFDEINSEENVSIIRSGEHFTINTQRGNSYYKMLCPSQKDRVLDLTEVTLRGGESYEELLPITHEGEECGYVIRGKLTVELNGVKHVLNVGDSIFFKANIPHKYMNETHEDCISVWAMTPRFF